MFNILYGKKAILIVISVISIIFSPLIFGQSAGEQSLKKLLDGNTRYLNGNLKEKNFLSERKEQTGGQKPYAIILTCSDSRVPPEIIFDEDLGDLFVIRVAGNVIDKVVLGSIEYAAEHLNAPLLVIMGHTKCGAVKASLGNDKLSENIETIVNKIHHSAELAKKNSKDQADQLLYAVKDNVVEQMKASIKESEVLKEMEHEGKLKIVGGLYDIEDGKFSIIKN